MTTFTFAESAFVPLPVGFFGLGTGYLIYGAQKLFALPERSRSVDLSTGIWGLAAGLHAVHSSCPGWVERWAAIPARTSSWRSHSR